MKRNERRRTRTRKRRKNNHQRKEFKVPDDEVELGNGRNKSHAAEMNGKNKDSRQISRVIFYWDNNAAFCCAFMVDFL